MTRDVLGTSVFQVIVADVVVRFELATFETAGTSDAGPVVVKLEIIE